MKNGGSFHSYVSLLVYQRVPTMSNWHGLYLNYLGMHQNYNPRGPRFFLPFWVSHGLENLCQQKDATNGGLSPILAQNQISCWWFHDYIPNTIISRNGNEKELTKNISHYYLYIYIYTDGALGSPIDDRCWWSNMWKMCVSP